MLNSANFKLFRLSEKHFHSQFLRAYQNEPRTKQLHDLLEDGQFHPRFALYDDLIITRKTPFRIFLPDDSTLRATLFQEIHNLPLAGHPGFHKFLDLCSSFVY